MRIPRTNLRFEPLNRGKIPGSVSVSPASSGFRLPTGRRDVSLRSEASARQAGAPKRFMGRSQCLQARTPHPQPSPRLDGERELFPFGACVKMARRPVLNPGIRRFRQLRHPGPGIIESAPLPP